MTSNKDRYHWRAVYRDGTVINEYDERGETGGREAWRSFNSVNRRQTQAVMLIPQHPDDRVVRLDIPTGCMPIAFRRRFLVDGAPAATIHCLGVEYPDGNCLYLFVLPDGSVILSDDLNAI